MFLFYHVLTTIRWIIWSSRSMTLTIKRIIVIVKMRLQSILTSSQWKILILTTISFLNLIRVRFQNFKMIWSKFFRNLFRLYIGFFLTKKKLTTPTFSWRAILLTGNFFSINFLYILKIKKMIVFLIQACIMKNLSRLHGLIKIER